MPTYLHYYFSNNKSSFSSADYDSAKRKSLLEQQSKIYSSHVQNLISNSYKDSEEVGKILDLLINDSTRNNQRKDIYDNVDTSSLTPSSFTVDGISVGSLGASMKYIETEAEKILNQTDHFQIELNKVLDQAYNSLGTGSGFEEYKESIVKEYIQKKGLSSSDKSSIATSIINDFLSHDGLKIMQNKGQGTMRTSLNSLTLLAYALPIYEFSGGVSYSTGRSKTSVTLNTLPEFFKAIASKTSGHFNNVKGGGAELTAVAAELALHEKIADAVQNTDLSVKTSGDDYISGEYFNINKKVYKTGNQLDEEDIKNLSFHRSKGDVTVSVSANGVSISYGISVKEYTKPNTASADPTVNLVSKTNFLAAANRILGGNGIAYMYNLAGGHGDGNRRTGGSTGLKWTNAQLDNEWEELKKTVIIGNFLNFIAGLPSENVIYLVANRKIYFIEDIVNAVVENESLLSGRVNIVKRETMMRSNKWINGQAGENRNALDANTRSNAAISSINAYLQKATITLDVTLLSSMVR